MHRTFWALFSIRIEKLSLRLKIPWDYSSLAVSNLAFILVFLLLLLLSWLRAGIWASHWTFFWQHHLRYREIKWPIHFILAGDFCIQYRGKPWLLASQKCHIPKLPLNLVDSRPRFHQSQLLTKTQSSYGQNLREPLYHQNKPATIIPWLIQAVLKQFLVKRLKSKSEVFGSLRSWFDHLGEVQIA